MFRIIYDNFNEYWYVNSFVTFNNGWPAMPVYTTFEINKIQFINNRIKYSTETVS